MQVRKKSLKLRRSFGHPGSRKSQCPAEKVLAKACLHRNINRKKNKKKNRAGRGKDSKKRIGELQNGIDPIIMKGVTLSSLSKQTPESCALWT